MHDLDSIWKQLAVARGIDIGDDTDAKIIVNDLFDWSHQEDIASMCTECQFRAAQSQISLSFHSFPKQVEFIGHDICQDWDRPAMSKF